MLNRKLSGRPNAEQYRANNVKTTKPLKQLQGGTNNHWQRKNNKTDPQRITRTHRQHAAIPNRTKQGG